MFPIIGVVVVVGCIAGGYLIEKGNLLVLMQPAELLIILGAAIAHAHPARRRRGGPRPRPRDGNGS
jgi:flagellar motor component MotA